MRRQNFINKMNFDEEVDLIENVGNDSIAYKTTFYDFRGEKGRDKSRDISPDGFKLGNYQTTK